MCVRERERGEREASERHLGLRLLEENSLSDVTEGHRVGHESRQGGLQRRQGRVVGRVLEVHPSEAEEVKPRACTSTHT